MAVIKVIRRENYASWRLFGIISLLSVRFGTIWRLFGFLPIRQDNWRSFRRMNKMFPRVMPYEEMLAALRGGASIARFGDGEFNLAMGKGIGFQSANPELSRRLREILAENTDDNMLVGISPIELDFSMYKPKSRRVWRNFWRANYNKIRPMLKRGLYANAMISRIDFFAWAAKSGGDGVAEIKKIWDGRNAVFVVPQNGRFFYDRRLFGNIKSKAEIFIPAADAFGEYERMLAECKRHKKDRLFIICAGPTATVLAYDLHRAGFQALDMGHLPNSLAEYLGEGPKPERLAISTAVAAADS
ncbi:MAG: GT-D fold domain-containing protein [Rickettsiales bacterium]|jgi:glycosyltransferase family protein|nr:GT-D fold domain-containing protein [Rickettsiales bacterium]